MGYPPGKSLHISLRHRYLYPRGGGSFHCNYVSPDGAVTCHLVRVSAPDPLDTKSRPDQGVVSGCGRHVLGFAVADADVLIETLRPARCKAVIGAGRVYLRLHLIPELVVDVGVHGACTGRTGSVAAIVERDEDSNKARRKWRNARYAGGVGDRPLRTGVEPFDRQQ